MGILDGRAERADRDLTAVGDQELGEHRLRQSALRLAEYSLSGRISALDAVCSMMWAVQPVIRLITKSGVKLGMSKPIR